MKASEITPCVVCGDHPLQAHGTRWITFRRVTVERFVLDRGAAGSFLGLAMHFGQGNVEAPGAGLLAEIMGGDPHVMKTDPALRTEALVCEVCASEASLTRILEAAARAEAVPG